MSGISKYETRAQAVNSLLCVGLDSDTTQIPAPFSSQFQFNKSVIDQTHPYVCAYKPNIAFYEALGAKGWDMLAQTMDYLDVYKRQPLPKPPLSDCTNPHLSPIP